MLEDLQKQARHIDPNDPVTDATTLGMAVTDILKSGQYRQLEEGWSCVAPINQNWMEWKRRSLDK